MTQLPSLLGNFLYIDKAVTEGMNQLKTYRKLVVQYEDFCQNPITVFKSLVKKLGINKSAVPYSAPEKFELTRNVESPDREAIEKALAKFSDKQKSK